MISPMKTRSPKKTIAARSPSKKGTPDKKVTRENVEQSQGAPMNLSVQTTGFDANLQDLFCNQEVLRSSPELWPEQIPGVVEFATLYGTSPILSKTDTAASTLDSALDKDDHDMLQEFGSLTTSQLMEKVKALQNLAYQLGKEEAREMTRGKFLNILGKTSTAR